MDNVQVTFWDNKLNRFPTDRNDLLDFSPTFEVQTAFLKHYDKIHGYDTFQQFKRIMVSISGGSDSDILIDMIERIGYPKGTVKYVFFNTGIEFQATKDHIKELEEKYGVEIEECKAKMPTTIACKRFGQPFLSKKISDYIGRLQRHGFKWEDEPYDVLIEKYPKCATALKWWCNKWGENSQMNISRRAYLKEFMASNPPDFSISDKCCQKSKKDTAHQFEGVFDPDLNVQGVRKGEGGARATAYTSCFDEIPFGCSKLRPVFWFSDNDKEQYCKVFSVQHSKCYTQYGLTRTGCACCPFGGNFEYELEVAKRYEPGLYKVAIATFGKSYEYTRKYFEFRDRMKKKNKQAEMC